MKNLLAIFLMAILFVSCEGEIGPMGPPGNDGKDGATTEWLIEKDIAVYPSDWKLVNDQYGNPFFMYEYRVKDKDMSLYEDAYDEGLITGYMYLDFGTNREAQTALPNPVNRRDDDNNTWTDTYAAEYTVDGFIIFKVTMSDFFVEERPLEAHFRIALTY
ncbi:hypothetical protein [Parabacteroides gordonii]|uniref:hypothetical protein n=1 Tax=Parabacteroides gordonii TaxID=574930 RepID=UPI0026EAD365|nr:hypothetical protein [Parabacteroides gordonii]